MGKKITNCFSDINYRWRMSAYKWWYDAVRWAKKSKLAANTSKSSMFILHVVLLKFNIQMTQTAKIVKCSHMMRSMIKSTHTFHFQYYFLSYLNIIFDGLIVVVLVFTVQHRRVCTMKLFDPWCRRFWKVLIVVYLLTVKRALVKHLQWKEFDRKMFDQCRPLMA